MSSCRLLWSISQYVSSKSQISVSISQYLNCIFWNVSSSSQCETVRHDLLCDRVGCWCCCLVSWELIQATGTDKSINQSTVEQGSSLLGKAFKNTQYPVVPEKNTCTRRSILFRISRRRRKTRIQTKKKEASAAYQNKSQLCGADLTEWLFINSTSISAPQQRRTRCLKPVQVQPDREEDSQSSISLNTKDTILTKWRPSLSHTLLVTYQRPLALLYSDGIFTVHLWNGAIEWKMEEGWEERGVNEGEERE